MLREQSKSAEHMVATAEHELLRAGQLKPGDVLGVVAGTRLASGSTNFMRLHSVTTEENRQSGPAKPGPGKSKRAGGNKKK